MDRKFKFAKVTDAAVDSLMNCYQVATNKTGGGGDGGNGNFEFVMTPAGFSGPILLSSCMHPTQIQEQRLQSRDMSVVLDMYEIMNAEIGRMVRDADAKRDRKRNATNVAASKSADVEDSSGSSSDDDDDDGGGGGGNGKVDFGW